MINVDYASYAKDAPHVSKQINLAALFPWTYDLVIGRGQTMVMASLDDLPSEAEEDRRSHTMLGNKSALIIPLFIGSRVHHLLTLDARKTERLARGGRRPGPAAGRTFCQRPVTP